MSSSVADVTVIVVTYNSAHCMAGLGASLSGLPHVVIVDNASDDDSIAQAQLEMPNAQIIRNERNLGFGAANNRALIQTQTPYALLLNPDCLPTPDFLPKLLATADQFPDAAIIAPHLLRRDGDVELNYRWPGTHWRSSGPAADGPCCVGFICGAVMLLNMTVMREIGFFDETFFLYYEDEDLSQRVFMQHKEMIIAPDVTVTHLSRGSVKGPSPWRAEFGRGYHHAQSKLIFTGKHLGPDHVATLRRKTLALAFVNLLPRLVLPFPRYLARLLGRICGLISFKP
jgi:N-acetylglucosaminyl-diphospho-decaprenol L-rhamnosyltransferase